MASISSSGTEVPVPRIPTKDRTPFVRKTTVRSLRLVMVGKPWTTDMRRFILENEMSNVALELTGVANEDLRALYSTASMMLFPSLQEGFGWPIVEAQACGCPVATSRRGPMDEVAGEAAVYIDPENPESAAAILNRALENMEGRRESSIANAARFRSGMIDNYLLLYDKVCREKTERRAAELDVYKRQCLGISHCAFPISSVLGTSIPQAVQRPCEPFAD